MIEPNPFAYISCETRDKENRAKYESYGIGPNVNNTFQAVDYGTRHQNLHHRAKD